MVIWIPWPCRWGLEFNIDINESSQKYTENYSNVALLLLALFIILSKTVSPHLSRPSSPWFMTNAGCLSQGKAGTRLHSNPVSFADRNNHLWRLYTHNRQPAHANWMFAHIFYSAGRLENETVFDVWVIHFVQTGLSGISTILCLL